MTSSDRNANPADSNDTVTNGGGTTSEPADGVSQTEANWDATIASLQAELRRRCGLAIESPLQIFKQQPIGNLVPLAVFAVVALVFVAAEGVLLLRSVTTAQIAFLGLGKLMFIGLAAWGAYDLFQFFHMRQNPELAGEFETLTRSLSELTQCRTGLQD